MPNKTFYAAAFQEIQLGHIDDALWVKVNADMPGANKAARQAKYVQLRAQEMATRRSISAAKDFAERVRKPLLYVAIILIGLLVAAAVASGLNGHL